MAEGRPLTAEGRPLTAESRPPMASPIFADDPLGALALAEAMGELRRSLSWRDPRPRDIFAWAEDILGTWAKQKDGTYTIGQAVAYVTSYRLTHDPHFGGPVRDLHIRILSPRLRPVRGFFRRTGEGWMAVGNTWTTCPFGAIEFTLTAPEGSTMAREIVRRRLR